MSEEASAIDVYYDMDIAQICQHFNKSRNTVDKAIAKLVKDNPDKDWKYKNPITRRITIKAEGVERLSTYFRKEKHEVSTVEMELRFENEKLKAIIEEKEKAQAQIEQLYQEKLKLETEKRLDQYQIDSIESYLKHNYSNSYSLYYKLKQPYLNLPFSHLHSQMNFLTEHPHCQSETEPHLNSFELQESDLELYLSLSFLYSINFHLKLHIH